MWRLIVLVAVLGACDKPRLRWQKARATTIELGNVVIPVPNGWRDGRELLDPQRPKQAGVADLVPEDENNFDSIQVRLVDVVWNDTTCDELAKPMQVVEHFTIESYERAMFAGDRGCEFRVITPRQRRPLIVARNLGSTTIDVLCWHGSLDAACDRVVYGTKLR